MDLLRQERNQQYSRLNIRSCFGSEPVIFPFCQGWIFIFHHKKNFSKYHSTDISSQQPPSVLCLLFSQNCTWSWEQEKKTWQFTLCKDNKDQLQETKNFQLAVLLENILQTIRIRQHHSIPSVKTPQVNWPDAPPWKPLLGANGPLITIISKWHHSHCKNPTKSSQAWEREREKREVPLNVSWWALDLPHACFFDFPASL